MVIIFWILFGLIIGWIATIIDDLPHDGSAATNLSLGVVGSIVGGVLGRALEEGSSYASGNINMMLAIIGGVLTILAVKGWKKRRTD